MTIYEYIEINKSKRNITKTQQIKAMHHICNNETSHYREVSHYRFKWNEHESVYDHALFVTNESEYL